MPSLTVVAFFVLSWVVFILVVHRLRKRNAVLEKAREKIAAEESRVFDFLHGLGSAFRYDLRTEELHRLMVEGAMNILDAQGGALYLAERQAKVLSARHLTKNCPALIEIPANLDGQPHAQQSYVRMHTLQPGESPVGGAWRDREPALLVSGDPRLAKLGTAQLRPGSAMVCPLIYGEQNLGVLALANGPVAPAFTPSDLHVFKAIAEQSAFALFNAIIYFEAVEKRRLDHDLQIAQDIQRILLPSNSPDFPGFEISGSNLPAGVVSGDYFDYLSIGEQQLGVAIADVSGKGVPASLIMAMCRSVLHSHAIGHFSGADVLRQVNRQLYPDIKEDMFISMAYVILDNAKNTITLCRAGHDAPMLYSARTREVTRLNPPGMALGIDSGGVFDRITSDSSVTLEPDDYLILYTDGVTEALNSQGDEFGTERMIESIQASAQSGAYGMIERITDDVQSFVGSTPRNDDITLIVIRKK